MKERGCDQCNKEAAEEHEREDDQGHEGKRHSDVRDGAGDASTHSEAGVVLHHGHDQHAEEVVHIQLETHHEVGHEDQQGREQALHG
jgi:hypothetical protein